MSLGQLIVFLENPFVRYSQTYPRRDFYPNMHLATLISASAFFIAGATAVSTNINFPAAAAHY